MNRLVYLQTFLEAYRTGSLTRAAQKLGITQPAASSHIASLEGMMGKALFVRQARGVTATPAGDDLARSIAIHLDGLDATMTGAVARSSQLAGTVHLAGPAEYLTERIAPALIPLMTEGVRFRIQIGNRDRIYEALDGGHVDLAIVASRPDNSRYGLANLARERLQLVASEDLAERTRGREVTPEFLCRFPLVAYDETLPLVRTFFEEVFSKSADLQAAVTAPDLRILLSLIVKGAGWTVLPDYICESALRDGQLLELTTERPAPFNQLYLIWNKGALRHPRVVYVRDSLIAAIAASTSFVQGPAWRP